jgi:hypothetical protein
MFTAFRQACGRVVFVRQILNQHLLLRKHGKTFLAFECLKIFSKLKKDERSKLQKIA